MNRSLSLKRMKRFELLIEWRWLPNRDVFTIDRRKKEIFWSHREKNESVKKTKFDPLRCENDQRLFILFLRENQSICCFSKFHRRFSQIDAEKVLYRTSNGSHWESRQEWLTNKIENYWQNFSARLKFDEIVYRTNANSTKLFFLSTMTFHFDR